MTMQESMHSLGLSAKEASLGMNKASAQSKKILLESLAAILAREKENIIKANALDLARAQEEGLDAPRMDRLRITDAVLSAMQEACLHVAKLPDPIGALEEQWMRPNGMLVGRMRIPLGVIAMIYESRPNVTIDAAILCLKAGNSVILRGGREALQSNLALVNCLRAALEQAGLPKHAVQFVETTDHAAVLELCHLEDCIDVMIPRGGERLVSVVSHEARMPVLQHFKGVCHCYLDAGCNQDMALDIVYNGKVQRPGVCNALECVLIHASVAPSLLPRLAARMPMVTFHACPQSYPILQKAGANVLAREDYGVEFHDRIVQVRVVESLDEALLHIKTYSSKHTDVIVTNDLEHSTRFVREVDSSMVGVNVSTRFNDGGQLGLGAEIGISTSKLHAFGPMGVRELTTTKFVVMGQGQVRES